MPRTSLYLLAGILACFACPALAQTTVPVDVHGAYLHTDTADNSTNAVPIGLAGLGLAPGYTIRIESVGDWNNGPGGDIYNTMLAVFSGSGTLLSPDLLHRVPDAIDAGVDVSTPYTWPNSQPMDIDEDFAFDALGTEIVIPAGATHLFVSVRDNYYQDNSDPDADCGVKITLVSTTAVEPGAAPLTIAAYPNPFRAGTTIRFDLARAAATRLTVHDVAGRVVFTRDLGELPAGSHQVAWDGRDTGGRRLAPGSYFFVVEHDGRYEGARLSLLR